MGEEWLAARVHTVELLHRHRVQVFVGNAPDIGVVDAGLRDFLAVVYFVAVVAEEVVHVVERAVAAIQELRGVLLRIEHTGQTEQPLVVLLLVVLLTEHQVF